TDTLSSAASDVYKRQALPRSFDVYYKMLTLREAFRIYASARALRLFVVLEGYVPAGRLKEFLERVSRAGGGSVLAVVRGEVRGLKEEPPTYVEVPWYLKPIHMITELYGVPSPKEIVPTLFMAFSFPIIYGLMFPDAGHALLLLAAGWYFYTHSLGSQTKKVFGMLITYVGVVSLVTGILAAEFFGPWTPVSHALTNLFGGHPPYASPVHPLAEKMIAGEEVTSEITAEIQELLRGVMFLSLRIGAIMLVLGSVLGFLNALIEGRKEEAFLSRLPKLGVFFFATLSFLAASSISEAATYIGVAAGLSSTKVSSIIPSMVRWGYLVSLLALILGEPLYESVRGGPGVFKRKLSSSFMEGFETLLMTISNTASFLRIMGLALAHSGLMFGFTILALMVYGGPVGIAAAAIYILGNLLVAGLEAIIVFAHTLRLHFYEWFSKFYLGHGVKYEPAKAWIPIVLRI
ncbi:MAG: V-type ATPase 116kDa subunit family protein, partial [Candidatus Korarchaeota archaeon]|nr:V-type ATPase 116kDa subunit family protein [Candidatus Korarchaeota archaeon]